MQNVRLIFVDNIRILLVTLVIAVHLSVTYGGVGDWYYIENRTDTVSFVCLTWLNAACQAFFMGLFFLLAGYFTPASYDRKGARRFLADRLRRLAVPLLFYDLVLHPLIAYPLFRTGAWQLSGSYTRWLARYYTSFHIGAGPLWFVETLLVFTILYVLFRALARPRPPDSLTSRPAPGLPHLLIFAAFLAAATFAVRLRLPMGWSFTPLNLQLPFFPQYVCMFVLGIAAARNDWLLRLTDATGLTCLIVAAVLILVIFPGLFVAGGALEGKTAPFAGGPHWQSLAYSTWEQMLCVMMSVALIVLFRKRLNRCSMLSKAASDSAYAAYIIHAPIIILLAIAAADLRLPPIAKFALAFLIAVPLCFAIAHLVRRLPLAARVL